MTPEEIPRLRGPEIVFEEQSRLPFDGRSGRVTDIDGKVWDLNVRGASEIMVATMTRYFAKIVSRSENEASRGRANKVNFLTLKGFLRFAAKNAKTWPALSTGLMQSYQTMLYRDFAAATAYGRYRVVRAAVLRDIELGVVDRFPVPRNPNVEKVAVTKKAGRTFATLFQANGYADANVANEDLLRRFRDMLWNEVEALRRRPDLSTSPDAWTLFVGCVMGLLSIACVNSLSMPQLEVDDLTQDSHDVSMRRLRYDKWRSSGEVELPAFPVGGAGARTIPRLWEAVVEVGASIRELAPDPDRKKLLVRLNKDGTVERISDEFSGHVLRTLRNFLARGFPMAIGRMSVAERLRRTMLLPTHIPAVTADDPDYTVIRANLGLVSFASARATAINVASARLRRNSRDTQKAVGHRSSTVLEASYLQNAQYGEDLDVEIRSAQGLLRDWASHKMPVVPVDRQAVAEATGASPEAAEEALADKFNLGMGASLVNDTTIVIDTPLNALRMLQWIEALRSSEARMVVSNPDRWRAVYEPQLVVFQQALEDFSRASRSEANRMSKTISLPFPEIV